MILKEAIQQAINIEKTSNKNSILYKVFEDGILIYVGIGGRGERKGSGRLKEHLSKSVYSSFRQQYYFYCWDMGDRRKVVDDKWNMLNWEIKQFDTFEKASQLEKEIIKTYSPKFNR